MGEGRLVQLPEAYRLPAGPEVRHVQVHGLVNLRGDGTVVAACGVGGCSPPWVVGVSPEEGSESGKTPEIATRAARELCDHLGTHHGLVRPNVGVLETQLVVDQRDWGREL